MRIERDRADRRARFRVEPAHRVAVGEAVARAPQRPAVAAIDDQRAEQRQQEPHGDPGSQGRAAAAGVDPEERDQREGPQEQRRHGHVVAHHGIVKARDEVVHPLAI